MSNSTMGLMMAKRPYYAPPGSSPPAYSGPGAGIYTRNYTITGSMAGTFPFQVRIPTGYSNSTPHRAMICIAPNGRGTDGTSMMSDTMMATIDASGLDCICIYGQWANGASGGRPAAYPMIRAVLETVQSEWNVDPLRVYLTGWSLSGLIASEALYIHNDIIAAAMVSNCYIPAAGAQLAGAPVVPFTHTEAATEVAASCFQTAVKQFQNADDTTIGDALAVTMHDGFIAASHPAYSYEYNATGGHDPGHMLQAGCSVWYTGWLFLQSK